jgi:predicted amino acid dehydrogenase
MKKYDFAFIVHSRNRTDLPRKYPILRYLPNYIFDWMTLNLPPIKVSAISGAVDNITGSELRGLIIGIPMTAHQLLEHRELALKKILSAVKLAKNNGAKYIGLGAMTASLSKGGKDIIETIDNIHVTTGRTYTAKNITDYIIYIIKELNLDINKIKIGIVGAAGGIGSGVAMSLAKYSVKNFVLIDLERKLPHVSNRILSLEKEAKDLNIISSHSLKLLSDCKIIVAATNSPEIVIKSEDVNSGTIIINDAQPSDIDPYIVEYRKDVLVIEGGVLHTPNIDCHFNMGLKHKTDIYSCLAEVILLSVLQSKGHYSIDDFDEHLYHKLSSTAKSLGFEICMQNDLELISSKRFNLFRNT